MCAVSNDWGTGMISLDLVGYADAQAQGHTRRRPLMTLTARADRSERQHPNMPQLNLGATTESGAVEACCWPLFDVSAREVLCGTDRTASQGQASRMSALVAGRP